MLHTFIFGGILIDCLDIGFARTNGWTAAAAAPRWVCPSPRRWFLFAQSRLKVLPSTPTTTLGKGNKATAVASVAAEGGKSSGRI